MVLTKQLPPSYPSLDNHHRKESNKTHSWNMVGEESRLNFPISGNLEHYSSHVLHTIEPSVLDNLENSHFNNPSRRARVRSEICQSHLPSLLTVLVVSHRPHHGITSVVVISADISPALAKSECDKTLFVEKIKPWVNSFDGTLLLLSKIVTTCPQLSSPLVSRLSLAPLNGRKMKWYSCQCSRVIFLRIASNASIVGDANINIPWEASGGSYNGALSVMSEHWSIMS